MIRNDHLAPFFILCHYRFAPFPFFTIPSSFLSSLALHSMHRCHIFPLHFSFPFISIHLAKRILLIQSSFASISFYLKIPDIFDSAILPRFIPASFSFPFHLNIPPLISFTYGFFFFSNFLFFSLTFSSLFPVRINCVFSAVSPLPSLISFFSILISLLLRFILSCFFNNIYDNY